jgi:hypothetical protein
MCRVNEEKVYILEADIVEPYAGFLFAVNRRVKEQQLVFNLPPHTATS